jgi:hypothetical protein
MADHTFQNCQPYRGLGVVVRIAENCNIADGTVRRYSVTWYLHKEGSFVSANIIASVVEPLDFASPREALGYAERRAHTFADCTFP